MVSSFLLDVITITGTGSKTYSVPAGGELFLGQMMGLSNNTYVTCSANQVSWSISTASISIMVMCRSR